MTAMARPRGVVPLRMPGMDGVLVTAVLVLIGFGIVMVAASPLQIRKQLLSVNLV